MFKNKWSQVLLCGLVSIIIEGLIIALTGVDQHKVLLQGIDAKFLSFEQLYGFTYKSFYSFQFFLIGRALGLFKFSDE